MNTTTEIPQELKDNLPEGTKRVVATSCGFIAYPVVAATVEDFDRLGNGVGSCLADANANYAYRGSGSLPLFRTVLASLLAEETGIEREMVPTGKKKIVETKDENGNPVTVEEDIMKPKLSDAAFIDKVLTDTNTEASDWQELADKASKDLHFSPASRESTGPKPRKPTKQAYEIADKMITEGKAERLAEHVGGLLDKTITLDGENDREILAQAVHANELREQAIARKQRLAAYAEV